MGRRRYVPQLPQTRHRRHRCVGENSGSTLHRTAGERRLYRLHAGISVSYTHLTDDGDYIANLFVTYINGQYSSNFGFDDNADVAAALSGDAPMALVAESEMLILQTAAGNALLTEGDSDALLSRSIVAYPRVAPLMQETSIKNSDVTAAKHVSTRSEDFSVGLNVPYVANDYRLIDPTKPDTPSNRKYLCWAASVAMVSNYRNGTSYSTKGLFNSLDQLYIGTPEGSTTWYSRAYSYCGMVANHQSSAMDANLSLIHILLPECGSHCPYRRHKCGSGWQSPGFHRQRVPSLHQWQKNVLAVRVCQFVS